MPAESTGNTTAPAPASTNARQMSCAFST
jgi:hypothetical protein